MFGFSALFEVLGASKAHRLLEANQQRFAKMNAKTFSMSNMGKTSIYTIEPENVKAMLATHFQSWSLPELRKTAFYPLFGHGIFTNDGAAWKHSREMLKPSFNRNEIGNVDMLERHAANLIRAIRTQQHQDSIDLHDLFFRLTTDFATEYLLGEATDSLEKGAEDGFNEAFEGSMKHIGEVSRIGRLGLLIGRNKFLQQKSYLHAFVDRYVVQALERQQRGEKHTRHTFLEELVQQTSDVVTIRSELLNILLAGRDTTASLLTNIWHILAQRPDIVARLREEIASNLPAEGTLPTFEDLKGLPYLSAVFKEMLRLYPVVPLNSRQATVSTTLPKGGGSDGLEPVFIGKGQLVIYSTYAMHRDVDVFGDDADVCRPERWLDGDDEKGLRPGWAYIPFNAGPRICLGQQLALTEASYVTVRLLQEFGSVEPRDDKPWTESLGLTCVNKFGAKVALF
ncbi:hypothetical protein QM012_007608 [Aureobasidium pullulans]|uniref:P450 monooxygenase n=1 Tax=Aureobasidium pullulans TaxID=5580 RepID=A0ABR0TK94_AURPU